MIALVVVALSVLGAGLADAQPARPARVAILLPGSPPGAGGLAEFRTALRDLGHVEGQNLVLEVYWEEGRPDRWPGLAQEILRRGVDVVVSGRGAATRAVRQATTTVPLVAATLDDPVRDGFAKSLARPGRNVTGFTLMSAELGGKRVDLMKQALPNLTRAALMWDVQHAASPPELGVADATARTLGFKLERLGVNGPGDLDGAFDRATRARVGAVIMAQGAIFSLHRARVAELALRHRLPTISGESGFAAAGGLMNYGPNIPDNFRRAAGYVDRILKGTKPGDLPIEQPEKFEFAINLRTAKALGLTIPQSVLVRADEVIQ